MAVVIRLARFGAIHSPKYRVTVADSRSKKEGKCIEVVGHYNPTPRGKEEGLKLDLAKIKAWQGKGARLTPRVSALVESQASAK